MSEQIINLRSNQPYDFRCDRKSPVGNPYTMYKESERDKVCEQYAMLFDHIMHDVTLSNVGGFKAYVQQIVDFHKQHGHVTLACWCSPKRCHCEIIKQWVLKPW